MALPLSDQVVVQLTSLGVTENTLVVPVAAATRYGVVAGEAAVTEQEGKTVTCHVHFVVS
jgi:hypothetical protein